MRKIRHLSLLLIGIGLVADVCAAEDKVMLTSHRDINGQVLQFCITKEEYEKIQRWDPSMPLPLSISNAVQLVRKHTREGLEDVTTDEVRITRIFRDNKSEKWYYSITTSGRDHRSRVIERNMFIVLFSGIVVSGEVTSAVRRQQ